MGWFLDATGRAENAHCTDYALRLTLVGARPFHKGTLWHIARYFQAVASLPESAKLASTGTYGVKMSNRFTQYILIAMALGIVMGRWSSTICPIPGGYRSRRKLIAMLFLR